MSGWIAAGPDGTGWSACLISGGRVAGYSTGPDSETALAALSDATGAGLHGVPEVAIGGGVPDALPAALLPDTGLILPSLCQRVPEDEVGAWTRLQVAGLRAARPDWDGVVCVPRAETVHWLHLSADEVVSCASTLTPRLHAALWPRPTGDAPGREAVAEALSRPERLMLYLRRAVLADDPGAGLGYLLGAELAATRAYWLGQQVIVACEGALGDAYLSVLVSQDVPVARMDPQALSDAGLIALGERLRLG